MVLEALRNARNSLDVNRWEFSDWTSCTCGHIYTGATGIVAVDEGAISPNGVHGRAYAEVIVAVAHALGFDPERNDSYGATIYVSDYTHGIAYEDQSASGTLRDGRHAHVRREYALHVINKAIEVIEEQEEAARLDVLAQTKAVVDNVELREEAVRV